MSARVEGPGLPARRASVALGRLRAAGVWAKLGRFGRSRRGQTALSCPFTAAYKFHKKEMNYALLSFHKVTQCTLTPLFSHLAQLLDEMTDLISFQIVLERVSLFHPTAAVSRQCWASALIMIDLECLWGDYF